MDKTYVFKTGLILFISLIFGGLNSYSQLPVVDGGRAIYARVDSFKATQAANDVDSLYLNNVSGFSPGDTVLFHHTISGNLYASGGLKGEIVDKNGGIYAIYLIETISGNLVILNNTLPPFGAYAFQNGDFGQLIKIPTYERARLTGSFSFPAWDPATKTGGIFPLLVNKKLVLEANMSANAKGFKGGIVNGDYVASGGVCSDGVFGPDDKYFTGSAVDSGAFKGESYNNKLLNLSGLTRGRGHIGSGGGGGNAKYSGGAGGGNAEIGGQGGFESNECSNPGDMGGVPGSKFPYTANPSVFEGNRIHMGGGGGAGTQSPANSRIGTSGGNGGGIIIILSDTVESVGTRTISANGESVLTVANAGAGGGGAGGVLIMDVSNYTGDSLNLQVLGGKGGNILPDPDITGPGGGGGGGLIQHNGATLPAGKVFSKLDGGKAGVVGITANRNGASDGNLGKRQGNLLVPIRGFLVNTVPDDQTICENTLAQLINANKPKGGSGIYTYKWQYSTNTINWFDAPGTNNLMTYQPPDPLVVTTHYRRKISDGILGDSTFFMTVNVQPALQNYLITSNDSVWVCNNVDPVDIINAGLVSVGGDGSTYSYTWEKSTDGSSYAIADGPATLQNYNIPLLNDTTYFRRKVESGVCIAYSDTVPVLVLDSIQNYLITEDQIVCQTTIPERLNGTSLSGGDPSVIRFEWFQDIAGILPEVTEDYAFPGTLSPGSYQYYRKVFSGRNDACQASSNQVTIMVYPSIANYELNSLDTTICAALPSITINGKIPTGGKSGDYNYFWEKKPISSGIWSPGGGTPNLEDLQPGTLNETTDFRRIVYSASTDSACVDTSSVITVTVLPVLINTVQVPVPSVICQESDAPSILAGATSGGTGTYSFDWQYQSNAGAWSPATGTENQDSYIHGKINDSGIYNFRRILYSGPGNTCTDSSLAVSLTIQPSIANNGFSTTEPFETCLGTDMIIAGLNISGGDGVNADYSWESSPDDINWSVIAAASGTNYTQPLNQPGWFRRIAESGACTDTSTSIFADTLSLPVLNKLELSDNIICTNTNDFFLKLTISSQEGDPSPYSITYNDGINSDKLAVFAGLVDSVNIFGLDSGNYVFSIVSIEDDNQCKAIDGLDQAANLRINKAANPQINETDSELQECDSMFSLLSIPDLDINAGPGYWTVSNSLINIANPAALTGEFKHLTRNFITDSLWVYFNQETSSCGTSSDSIKVTLYQPIPDNQPKIAQGDSIVLFITDKTLLEGVIPTAGFIPGPGMLSWSVVNTDAEISGTDYSVEVNNIPLEPATTVRYTLTNGTCTENTDDILIRRKDVHVFEGISPHLQDDINDLLIAEGLDVEGVSFTFQIFSSNGSLVRELNEGDLDRLGFEKGLANNGRVLWDGKNRIENNLVPQGTYYYVLIINYKGREFIHRNFVVVR